MAEKKVKKGKSKARATLKKDKNAIKSRNSSTAFGAGAEKFKESEEKQKKNTARTGAKKKRLRGKVRDRTPKAFRGSFLSADRIFLSGDKETVFDFLDKKTRNTPSVNEDVFYSSFEYYNNGAKFEKESGFSHPLEAEEDSSETREESYPPILTAFKPRFAEWREEFQFLFQRIRRLVLGGFKLLKKDNNLIYEKFADRPFHGLGKLLPIFMKTMKFLIGLFTFASFAALGATAFFIFYYQNGSPKEVEVNLNIPETASQGAPFNIETLIMNGSDRPLNEAKISLILPKNLVVLGSDPKDQLYSEKIDDIAPGILQKKNFILIAIAPLNDGLEEVKNKGKKMKITARLSYALEGRSGFEAETSGEVSVKDPAIKIYLEDEASPVSGSVFSFRIVYENISDYNFPSLGLEAEYPASFSFVSADLSPRSLNNVWDLGALRAGSKGVLAVRGVLTGEEGVNFRMPAIIRGYFAGKEYPILRDSVQFAVAPSPVLVSAEINGSPDYTARLGDVLNYKITYRNVSGVGLERVTVKASLRGELFNLGTVLSENGSVDAFRGTVVWGAKNLPALVFLEPGASGEVSFKVALKSQFPASRSGGEDFKVQAEIELNSPSVPYYLMSKKTQVILRIFTKVAGFARIETKALYRDAESGFETAGVVPPQAGLKTGYTMRWLIRNYGSDIGSVSVRAFLQPGVVWTGLIKSNINGAEPRYNDITREVFWEIPNVPAGAGVSNDSAEAIFQIEATPEADLIGKAMPLLSGVTLLAVDAFTGERISVSNPPLTTSGVQDMIGSGIVVP